MGERMNGAPWEDQMLGEVVFVAGQLTIEFNPTLSAEAIESIKSGLMWEWGKNPPDGWNARYMYAGSLIDG